LRAVVINCWRFNINIWLALLVDSEIDENNIHPKKHWRINKLLFHNKKYTRLTLQSSLEQTERF
jgi:hypothetical protein